MKYLLDTDHLSNIRPKLFKHPLILIQKIVATHSEYETR